MKRNEKLWNNIKTKEKSNNNNNKQSSKFDFRFVLLFSWWLAHRWRVHRNYTVSLSVNHKDGYHTYNFSSMPKRISENHSFSTFVHHSIVHNIWRKRKKNNSIVYDFRLILVFFLFFFIFRTLNVSLIRIWIIIFVDFVIFFSLQFRIFAGVFRHPEFYQVDIWCNFIIKYI